MISQSSEVSRTHTALPEVGQLVEVRRRQWIVADVQPS